VILVAATGNAGKLVELRALLDGLDLKLRSLADIAGVATVEEGGDSFLANARLKAHAVAAHAGLPALADDSGLEVDALGGAPGVRSARFALDSGAGAGDAANVALLLVRLRDVPPPQRTARFRCVIVVARPDGSELVADGACAGLIAAAPRGNAGFGYDPVFLYPPLGRTFAELASVEKDRVSHRAAAVAALRPQLIEFLR
jgi:XTP/dITP diphosphohydrolase